MNAEGLYSFVGANVILSVILRCKCRRYVGKEKYRKLAC